MPTYLHSGDLGDIVYALPMIQFTGAGALYLVNRPGTREPMTPARFEFIKPLLEAQPYITGCEMHKGQKITHDFTGFREGWIRNVTLAELQRRHVTPTACVRFEAPWLSAPEADTVKDIIIARSGRYHNPAWQSIWPQAMKMVGAKGFIGFKEEHAAFEKEFGKITYMPVQNALEMAVIIKASGLFIGNQSLPYAIAEALKANRILEVSTQSRDCDYSGGRVTHVFKEHEWPNRGGAGTIILALQFYPGDVAVALDLAELISEIEKPVVRDDVEIAVCPRDDVEDLMTSKIAAAFSKSFKRVHVIQTMRKGSRGWPDGANDLWQSTMMQLYTMRMNGGTEADAVLTFEPDCVPGTTDWIDRLMLEWKRVAAKNKLAFGHIHYSGPVLHMNGNMMIDIMAIKRFPELQSSGREWDMTHGKLFSTHGVHSSLILNSYNNNHEYTIDEFMAIEHEGIRPALIHGIKNNSGRNAVRAGFQEVPE